jgi:capsular polysaccharide export protein
LISGGIHFFSGKRVLLLQGPLGPFFARLAHDLRSAGAFVLKVNFNAGDALFAQHDAVAFRGSAEEWPAFLTRLLDDHRIDTVLLFGDCRPLHRVAHAIAQDRGIEVGVFEEGYVRPNYVTFERFGVNGHSLIPRSSIFYLNSEIPPCDGEAPVGNTYWHSVLWAITYYTAAILGRPFFSKYEHHRPLVASEALRWIRSFWRKLYYRAKEAGLQERLTGQLSKRYFLVPLQVHSDAQVQVHSDFDSVALFIDHLLDSFAEKAPRDAWLVIKHHPYDRAYFDYTTLIRRKARSLGIGRRVRYIHDQHLPTLLQHARGVVVINSTVGLSALHHGTPTKVCGVALYDMAGLTAQCGLDEFWGRAEQEKVDPELYRRFRDYLIHATQINGSFYRRLDIPGMAAGLAWRPRGDLKELGEHEIATERGSKSSGIP